MNNTEFQDLCRDTCLALGLDDTNLLRDEGQVQVDGVDIAMLFDESDDADCIFCYVDLGQPPPDLRTQVWEQLLEMNLLHGSRTAGIYALDRESGHAVACMQLRDTHLLDGDFVAEMLRFYAEETRSAREKVENPAEPKAAALEDAKAFPLGGLFLNRA